MGQLMKCIESDDYVVLIFQCLPPDLDDVLSFCRNYAWMDSRATGHYIGSVFSNRSENLKGCPVLANFGKD